MIHWSINNTIGYLEFDNQKGNMLDISDLCQLDYIINLKLSQCSGLIISGKNKSFCTGVSLVKETASESLRLLDKILLDLYSLDIPVTIALTGHAIGAGFLIMCCADYIVARNNPNCKFGLPELKIGIGLDQFMAYLLSIQLSNIQLRQLVYSGAYIDTQILSKWEIISELTNENPVESCETFIKGIEYKQSFSCCKRSLNANYISQLNAIFNTKPFLQLTELINL